MDAETRQQEQLGVSKSPTDKETIFGCTCLLCLAVTELSWREYGSNEGHKETEIKNER